MSARSIRLHGPSVRITAVSIAILSIAYTASASPQSNTVRYAAVDSIRKVTILFRLDDSTIDLSYLNNPDIIKELEGILSDTLIISNLQSVAITGAASPEGDPEYNNQLAYRRGMAAKDYIFSRLPSASRVTVEAPSVAPYWESMIEMVLADPGVPSRGELLDLIRDPRTDDHAKNRQMIAMNGGATYRYLREGILKYLRTASICLSFNYRVELSGAAQEAGNAAAGIVREPEQMAAPEPRREQAPVELPYPLYEPKAAAVQDTIAVLAVATAGQCADTKVTYPFAIRTNLLFDLAGAPNIGIEVPIGNRFSAAVEIAYAYWRIDNLYALQTKQAGVEFKYWFDNGGNPLTGWNAGPYAIYCSRFDVQWKDGYQGDGFWSFGLVGGYSVAVGERLILDFSLGAGYWHSPEVRHYTRPRDGHLIWEETRYNVSRFSLTRARVNLVWLVSGKNRRGKQ